MGKCDLIGPYLYGDLSEADRRRMEAHLRECEACRTEVAALQALVTQLPTTLAEVPAGAETRVLRQVEARLAAERPRPRGPLRSLAFAGAALAVGVWIGYQLPRTGPPPARPALVEAQSRGTDRPAAPVKPVLPPTSPPRGGANRPLPPPVSTSRPRQASPPRPAARARRRPQAAPTPDQMASAAPDVGRRKVTVAPRPEGGDDVQVARMVEEEATQ
jgi:anti-sigma factor RsiW